MNFNKLEKNITDVIKEEQIKLGYRSETVHLYYPLSSLNRFLGTECGVAEMQEVLKGFCEEVKERLGEIIVTNRKERFCLSVPPAGVDYIHEQRKDSGFLADFIHTIEKHGCTLDDLLRQFYKHSDRVHVEKRTDGEFDYLIYFEDGVPDDYRYCVTDEGCHMIYHRFTPEDYLDFL